MERIEPVRKQGYLHEAFRLFYLRDMAGQELDYHYHEFNKLVIPLAGSVTYCADGVSYALQPWDVLLVKHHTIHRACIDLSEPYERYILYISPGYMSRALPGVPTDDCFEGKNRLLRLREEQRRLLDALLRELRGEMEAPHTDSEALCRVALLRLLILLHRANPPEQSAAITYDDKMLPILSYINEHLAEPISVDELARLAYLSRSHFMRLFKERMGCPVHSYIRRTRLSRAAQLISQGVPAGKAAAESGFSDYSVFLRAFRQLYHTTPNQWKP